MCIFKRRKWITVYGSWGYAVYRQLGRDYQVDAETVVQVKLKRDGTWKKRAFIRDIKGNHLSDISVSYALESEKDAGLTELKEILKNY